jgi:hypothetical protein
MPPTVDVSVGYRLARVDLVRTHDAYGPGDIDAQFAPENAAVPARRNALDIFPDPGADPEEPASYHFGPTDRLVGAIVDIGAQVLFRIGRSETSAVTPPDPDRYAAIVEHVVRHYNGGWASGFHYHVRYWEVWNEPDLGKLFWGGTPQQFYTLYEKLARAVKRADPSALVGGPTLAKPNDATAYREGFLSYVRARQLPLDFFSWHWYATDSGDPLDFVRIARDLRARLDATGFAHTLSVLDEWNYGLTYPLPSDPLRASFITAALIYMQDAPIDLSALYRADNLYGRNGATPNKTGQALIALGRMRDTPVRVHAEGGDLDGFALQAGRSRDGATVQVLISHYQIPAQYRGPRTGPDVLRVPNAFEVGLLKRRSVSYRPESEYELLIEHLASARYSIERYRISATRGLAQVERTTQTGPTLRLRASLPAPAVELIVIKAPRS